LKGLPDFRNAIGDVDELAHDGGDDKHGRLTCGGQASGEALAPIGPVGGDHGGHVQGFAHEGMTYLGQARLGLHAAAGFVLTRV